MGKRVFVSGGAGVIGLEMIPKLVARGAEVMVGDLKPRPTVFPSSVRYRQGDLNDLTQGEIDAFAPEVFIHLAATFERSTETYAFWEENFWHNVRLSHHLMSVLKDLSSLKRVVFASSYLIYDPALYQFDTPQSKAVSLRESDPVMPRNLTGMAKLAHEIELRFLDQFRSEAFTTACARIYRGYGRNSRDVISRWIRMLLAGDAITIYRPEGLFDYIYGKDSAEGLIRMAEKGATGILNLGTGRARRVQDVVDILRSHFPDMRMEEAASDIPYEASQADVTAYKAEIDWLPEYDLEQAIPEMIAHEREKSGRWAKDSDFTGNVLVSSASRKVPLVRALQGAARKIGPAIKVVAGDLDEEALSQHVADDFWRMPRTEDVSLDALVSGCHERGIRMVVPTRDGELPFWARHRETFEAEGIDVLVSPLDSVETCLDKLAFARFGTKHGLPVIPAALGPDDIEADRMVVKERFGAGAKSIGIDLDRQAAIEWAHKLENPIYQPFVSGNEISIDAWMDRDHQVKGLVLRRRDSVANGESQVTSTFRDPALEVVARRALEALKLRGPVVLQGFVDNENKLHIIECNSRFGGASTASIEAGLDMFYWSLLESGGADLSNCPFDRVVGEVRQIRVPSDIYVHGSGF